jgi:hypothetical protein
MTRLTCGEMQELAPELALGLLTGPERAAALAHLEGCAACRAEVASLTDVGEAVLALAPEVPPSAGFETRVVSRLGSPRPAPRSRRRRVVLASAAAVLVAAVLTAVLVVAGGGGGDAVAAADVRTSSGRLVGRATLSDDDPATVTVEMTDWLDQLRRYGRAEGRDYWLRVGTRDGRTEAYALPLGEPDPWHVTLDGEDGDAVVSVAVVDASGRTWCEASFA